jgi:hypothetical protein
LFCWIIVAVLSLLWLGHSAYSTGYERQAAVPTRQQPSPFSTPELPLPATPTPAGNADFTSGIAENSTVTTQKPSGQLRSKAAQRQNFAEPARMIDAFAAAHNATGPSHAEPGAAPVDLLPVSTPAIHSEGNQNQAIDRLPLRQYTLQPLTAGPLPTAFPALLPPAVPVPARRQRGFELGLGIGPIWTIRNEAPEAPAPGHNLVFLEKIHTSSGTQLGISLAYRFAKRWRIESGLWRQSSLQHTSHSAQLRLMDGVCLNPQDPGIKTYEFQYDLLTTSGPSDVTVRIAQVDPHVSMPADEPFTLYMSTTRRSVDWTIPLTVQRLIGNGPWQLALRAGSAGSMRSRTVLSVDHFTEQCIDLCFASNHTPVMEARQERAFAVQYLAGAGLGYQLSPRLSVQLEPVLSGTLWSSTASGRPLRVILNAQTNYAF